MRNRQTVTFPNLPAIDAADPAQTARNLRAVASRMQRAAADIEALTDPSKYDGGQCYRIDADSVGTGTVSIELSRDMRPPIPAPVDADDPASYVGRKLPNLLSRHDGTWFTGYMKVVRLTEDQFDGVTCGVIQWYNGDGSPAYDASSPRETETIGSFVPGGALHMAAECHNRHVEHLRDMREFQDRMSR